MSVERFCEVIIQGKYGKADKTWFPRWVRRYAMSVPRVNGQLPVTRESVIAFSRSLLQSQTPAWQRLQAVRAVEAYRDLVLQRSVPSLNDIRIKLNRLAAQERDQRREGAGTPISDEEIVGALDPNEPEVILELRRELRWQRLAPLSIQETRFAQFAHA